MNGLSAESQDYLSKISDLSHQDAKLEVDWKEWLIVRFLAASAGLSIFVTAAIIYVLINESTQFFEAIKITDFLFGINWSPLIEPREFGVLPLIFGTAMVAIGALLIALPIGLASAIYLSEYASKSVRKILKPTIELLAGVPSVVFGYFAVTTVTPFLQSIIPSTEIFNAASASIVLAFMVLPTITSLCDDAIRAVPKSLREAGFALAATKHEVALQVSVPAALSGILAAAILGFSRAIGETMAVALAAGSTPNLTFNPFVSAQTMTGYIVQVSMGDTPHGSIEYQSIFAVAALLFCSTLLCNMLSQAILRRLHFRYDS